MLGDRVVQVVSHSGCSLAKNTGLDRMAGSHEDAVPIEQEACWTWVMQTGDANE